LSGIAVEVPFSMLFTFRGRQIVRLEALDEGEALEPVGLSEQRCLRLRQLCEG
jgi:hypothetical protein